ncbi:hypothetical protein [Xanthobacter autotrophicus]|uniref:hypothetical protein n=1 Tax=Xanthobacter autotrophicus TaxID=280 RepID=UPI0024A765E0|nr:hypothetical protein [Xanthobacter autotrophicus]MDI4655533.1 hypothetical protein [Xanthobacter autotrophicus]
MTRRTSAGRPAPKARTIPFEHQPELRALMMFPTLPPGHMTFPVPDDAFYPHLRRGEFAVVDLADHQPAEGELFLISFTDPRVESGLAFDLCLMRSRPSYYRPDRGWLSLSLPREEGYEPAPMWSACFWIPPEDPAEYAAVLRSGHIGTSEGPFTTEHAAEKLVGRVVGVWVPGAEQRGKPSGINGSAKVSKRPAKGF